MMLKKTKVKTFILALNTFDTNVRKARTYLKDKRLTQSEKTIIQSYFLLRDNKTEEVIALLEKLMVSEFNDQIVESQGLLFLAYAYNNKSLFSKAIPLFEKAIELMQGYALTRQEFIALNNLFVLYRNLKNFSAMKFTLKRMQDLGAPDKTGEICLLHNNFKFASVTGDYPKALECTKKLDALRKNMSEAQIISYLVDKFDFMVKTDHLLECYNLLNEMKAFRKFHLSANYNFMKLLLNNLDQGQTLYVVDSDFIKHPLLFNQIKVIQKLEEGNLGGAKSHWNYLKNLYPHIYLEDFRYEGDKCLFSASLEKHHVIFEKNNVFEFNNAELPKSKQDALLKILNQASAPVHQEIIYELIWDHLPESKNDLNKLARLVSTVREKTGINIKIRKSCYYLEKETQIKRSTR